MKNPSRPGWDAVGSALAKMRLDKIAFGVGLLAVAFGGGMASVYFHTIPFTWVEQAKAALDAELQIEDDRFPSNINGFVAAPKASTARRLSSRAGTEPLLMVGNFYSRLDLCPKFGCLAWTMDRDGRVLHKWPSPDPAELFKGAQGFTGRVKPTNFYVIGLTPGPDGSIVTTFHGRNIYPYQVGIAKFDANGRLLWKRFRNSHHWPTSDGEGRIYTPYVRIAERPGYLGGTHTDLKCRWGKVYMEGVRVISPQGVVEREFSAGEFLAKSDRPGLAYSVRDGCDPFHVNGVDLVNEAGARRFNATSGALPKVEVGDLLVSLREPSTLVVIDKDDGTLKRSISGRTSAQHSPKFLPDGRIVVFDNLGGQRKFGGSRVLLYDPETKLSKTVFPRGDEGPELLPFVSETSGAVNPSPDGSRIMISSSKQGRMIEVDVETGEPLWIYDNVMDFKPYLDAKGLKEDKTYIRLPTNGAFYLNGAGFQPRAGQGAARLESRTNPPG